MLSQYKKHILKWLMALFLALPFLVGASGITFKNFKVIGNAPSYQVLTAVNFNLTPYLQKALENGVALNTRVQFRLQQRRKWWFDKEKTLLTVHFQLKYHALSQHYLLTRNDTNEHWNFSNLSSALRKLGEMRKYLLPKLNIPMEKGRYTLFAVADLGPESLRLPLRIQSLFSDKYRLVSEGVLWPLP